MRGRKEANRVAVEFPSPRTFSCTSKKGKKEEYYSTRLLGGRQKKKKKVVPEQYISDRQTTSPMSHQFGRPSGLRHDALILLLPPDRLLLLIHKTR